jgi:hypothetical protein
MICNFLTLTLQSYIEYNKMFTDSVLVVKFLVFSYLNKIQNAQIYI